MQTMAKRSVRFSPGAGSEIIADHNSIGSDAMSSVTGTLFTERSGFDKSSCEYSLDDDTIMTRDVIYGRDEEIALLQEAFQRIQGTPSVLNEERKNARRATPTLSNRKGEAPLPRFSTTSNASSAGSSSSSSELIVLHGPSGTGKTKLIEVALRNYASDQFGGCLVSGKFDQLQMRGESFSALTSAFSDLCDLLTSTLTEPELEDLRAQLTQELGSEANALTMLIPNLSYLLPQLQSNSLFSTSTNDNRSNLNQEKQAGQDGGGVSGNGSGSKGFTRLKQLICVFLKTVVTENRPLAIFIDDLQWADEASMAIVHGLVKNQASKHVLFIVAFRDEEDLMELSQRSREGSSFEIMTEPDNDQVSSGSQHPTGRKQLYEEFVSGLGEGGSISIKCSIMKLGNLSVDSINEMIAEKTSSSHTYTRDLSELVHAKTNGNPYFVDQFIELLQRSKMMVLANSGTWEFDLERIRAETDVCENVVELVAFKIEGLSKPIQEAMKLASFLGHRFHYRLFEILYKDLLENGRQKSGSSSRLVRRDSAWSVSSNQTMDSEAVLAPVKPPMTAEQVLEAAIDEGLVEKNGIYFYKFSHDRVQQCLFSMAEAGVERDTIHLRIGRVLSRYWQDNLKDKDLSLTASTLLLATDHLNLGSALIEEHSEKMDLIQWNLDAGKFTLRQSAFVPSVAYLRRALALLNQTNKWVDHYDLTLKVCTTLGYLEFCNGNNDESDAINAEILRKGKRLHDKLDAYSTMVQCLGSQEGKLKDSVQVGVSVLNMLGENFPKKPNLWHIIKEMIKAKKAMKNLSDHDILNLPQMEDKDKIAAINVMNSMVFAIFSDEDSKPYFALISLRMMTLTCKYGRTGWTPAIVAAYGGLEAVIGNLKEAQRFLALTETLISRSNSKRVQSRGLAVMHGLLSQWFQPFPSALDGFKRGYILGMESGDFEHALNSANQYLCVALLSDMGLSEVEEDVRMFCQQMDGFGLKTTLAVTIPIWQITMNLMGDAVDDPAVLSGEALNLPDFEASLKHCTNELAVYVLLMCRTKLSIMYDRTIMMKDFFKPYVDGREQALRGHFVNFDASFLEGIMSYKLFHEYKKRIYRKHARQATDRLDNWAKEGVVNCVGCALFLQAERLVLKDRKAAKKMQVLKLYDEAIKAVNELGCLQWEAFFHERAVQVLLQVYGDTTTAIRYLNRATEINKLWEADAKVEWLSQKYMRLIPNY